MNERGHPEILVAAHPGNRNAVRHGVYSKGVIELRAAEIAEVLFGDFWFTADQRIAAHEVARWLAILEAIDRDLDERGLVDRKGKVHPLLDHRARISRRLDDWLTRISTAMDRQTAREYEGRLFTHDDYIREAKRIALSDDPKTKPRDRLSALKTLHLLELAWLQQWLQDYYEEHPEELADRSIERIEANLRSTH
jgi:hypothetical protein